MNLDHTEMDYVRAALANAYYSGLTLKDVLAMSLHAVDGDAFDRAVNMLPCGAEEEMRVLDRVVE